MGNTNKPALATGVLTGVRVIMASVSKELGVTHENIYDEKGYV